MLTEKKIRRLRDIMMVSLSTSCSCENCKNGQISTIACLAFIRIILGEASSGLIALEHDEKNFIKAGWLDPEPAGDDLREHPASPARI
jgi:hypothetical protein